MLTLEKIGEGEEEEEAAEAEDTGMTETEIGEVIEETGIGIGAATGIERAGNMSYQQIKYNLNRNARALKFSLKHVMSSMLKNR